MIRGREGAVRLGLLVCVGTMTMAAVLPLRAQEKPRVYVTPNTTRRSEQRFNERVSTVEDRALEISRDLSQSCPEVIVSVERRKSDYVLRLSWRPGQSAVAVYRRDGDLVGTGVKSTVGSAVKAACDVIKKDQARGGTNPAPRPNGAAANSTK